MITKIFKEDDEKRHKGLRWSLDAAGIENKTGRGNTVIASYNDVYQLRAWATVHREYYGWIPIEVEDESAPGVIDADPVLSESE
ncbi:MAG: hypothetical protein GY807_00080 [Gammaproteobacteria bacterium]|nr:hypothetical protein [Gammaproteobacteria bacterium]